MAQLLLVRSPVIYIIFQFLLVEAKRKTHLENQEGVKIKTIPYPNVPNPACWVLPGANSDLRPKHPTYPLCRLSTSGLSTCCHCTWHLHFLDLYNHMLEFGKQHDEGVVFYWPDGRIFVPPKPEPLGQEWYETPMEADDVFTTSGYQSYRCYVTLSPAEYLKYGEMWLFLGLRRKGYSFSHHDIFSQVSGAYRIRCNRGWDFQEAAYPSVIYRGEFYMFHEEEEIPQLATAARQTHSDPQQFTQSGFCAEDPAVSDEYRKKQIEQLKDPPGRKQPDAAERAAAYPSHRNYLTYSMKVPPGANGCSEYPRVVMNALVASGHDIEIGAELISEMSKSKRVKYNPEDEMPSFMHQYERPIFQDDLYAEISKAPTHRDQLVLKASRPDRNRQPYEQHATSTRTVTTSGPQNYFYFDLPQAANGKSSVHVNDDRGSEASIASFARESTLQACTSTEPNALVGSELYTTLTWKDSNE